MKMIKYHIKLFTLAAMLVFSYSYAIPSTSAEPAYDGKPLSQWLIELKFGQMAHYHNLVDNESPTPSEAIREIGTNGIPTLLKILGATDSDKWWVVERMKSRQFRKFFHDSSLPLNDLTDMGVQGFGILGTNAVSAIPKISELLDQWETCSAAAQALAELGPSGFEALTNGLYNENSDIRGVTIEIIGEKSSADSNTVARLMIGCLKDPNSGNRGSAARYLAGKDPSVAIPALLKLLDEDTNFDVITGASRALSSYGATAEVAVPRLLFLYTNNWDTELMWALQSIDKNAVAQAESFRLSRGPLGASYGYTITLLPDGKKLIVGGYLQTTMPSKKNYVFSGAKLFDPAIGKWIDTGSMNTARFAHTATLLHNGKVLVAGGEDANFHDLTSAELYDPATGLWTETGSMNSAHPNEDATLQADGKVRISGWIGDYLRRPNDDLYDPATGMWSVITNK